MRILELALALDQLAQPGELGVVLGVAAVALVLPVRRDAELGALVHLARADLHLHALAVRADHGRVQRLVGVGLGQRDVVLEAARHGRPDRVDQTERVVDGLLGAVEDDPERDHVVDLLERDALLLHLRVDRGEVLEPAGHLRPEPGLAELRGQNSLHLVDVELALAEPALERALEIGHHGRIQRAEGEVLELPPHPVDAEAVRERHVDVERLLRDAARLVLAAGASPCACCAAGRRA